MKKLLIVITCFLLLLTGGNSIAQNYQEVSNADDSWTGNIRLEGLNNTIWSGQVSFSTSIINVTNIETGLKQDRFIPYPSVLGAIDEASKLGGFNYEVDYYPNFNPPGCIIVSIDSENENWLYWVDDQYSWNAADNFELTTENKEIIFGCFTTWYPAGLLKINVSKIDIKKNEEISVTITNELDQPIENAMVYVGSDSYFTDGNGKVPISISNKGTYSIYAEKQDYVRSEKIDVSVKNKAKFEIFNLPNILANIIFFLKNVIFK